MRYTVSLLFMAGMFQSMAQAPQGLKYQAIVRDATGDPVDSSTVSFRLSILQTSAFGTSSYVETHVTTTTALGLVDLVIGNGTPVSGTFAGIPWGAHVHFLKVEVDPSGGSSYLHMGTSQLMSVPYAMYAQEAEVITDNTLDGNGTRLDTLRIAQQLADSGDVLLWNGYTWAPVNVTNIFPPGPDDHNTLDEAYDEGGGGAGRTITADSGAVEIRNTAGNIALELLDMQVAGTNTKEHLVLRHKGTATAARIEHTRSGRGLSITNDSITTGTARNNLEVSAVSRGAGTSSSADGRAILGMTFDRLNNHPTIEGTSLGRWHGIFGQSGQNDWGTFYIDNMPAAGVGGFSGTENTGILAGSDGPYEEQSFRRGRIGVAGLSNRNHGVWGMTNMEGTWNATTNPDSIIAAVVGLRSPYLLELSDTRFDHFGVAGLNATNGSGVLGIGAGHGVIGYSGHTEDATKAGVWGHTRVADWTVTKADYMLKQTGVRNKSRVGVLGTSVDRTGVWGESMTSVGVAATGGGQFAHQLLELESNVGLLAATHQGTAGKFLAEPDTATHTQLMLVKLAESSKHAGYFETRSDTITEPIVKIAHRAAGNALEIDANNHPPGPGEPADLLGKGHSIAIEHRADSSAAIYVRPRGSANALHVKSTMTDSAAIFVDDSMAVGIRGLSRSGRAGVMGISDKNDHLSAGLVGVGDSHADSAAAVEIKDGALRITGPSRTGGRITLSAPIVPAGDMQTCSSGCPPPTCGHDHATGFYFDVPITNDLISSTRTMLFLSATAKVNFLGAGPGGIYADYDAVTAHVLAIGAGTAVARVTCFISCPLDPYNAPLYYPETLTLDYLIVNL